MSDHDDSTPSLGCAEVSPVHDPVGPPIPEVFQTTDDGGHVVSGLAGRGEKPFGILDDHPSGLGRINESEVLSEESGELVEEAGSSASEPETMRGGDGGVGAREASADERGAGEVRSEDVMDVSSQRDVGEVAGEDLLALGVDLDHHQVAPVVGVETSLEPAYSRERGHVGERRNGHGATRNWMTLRSRTAYSSSSESVQSSRIESSTLSGSSSNRLRSGTSTVAVFSIVSFQVTRTFMVSSLWCSSL
jgi:hypothetical protein